MDFAAERTWKAAASNTFARKCVSPRLRCTSRRFSRVLLLGFGPPPGFQRRLPVSTGRRSNLQSTRRPLRKAREMAPRAPSAVPLLPRPISTLDLAFQSGLRSGGDAFPLLHRREANAGREESPSCQGGEGVEGRCQRGRRPRPRNRRALPSRPTFIRPVICHARLLHSLSFPPSPLTRSSLFSPFLSHPARQKDPVPGGDDLSAPSDQPPDLLIYVSFEELAGVFQKLEDKSKADEVDFQQQLISWEANERRAAVLRPHSPSLLTIISITTIISIIIIGVGPPISVLSPRRPARRARGNAIGWICSLQLTVLCVQC